MTTWLWIIGVTAVAWPVIVSLWTDHARNGRINRIAAGSENKGTEDVREQGLRAEISSLQAVVQNQDALIAALWQKTFGFHREGRYSGSALPEYLGVKPAWHPFEGEWAGPVDYLVRYEPYPWGTCAENLYFPD